MNELLYTYVTDWQKKTFPNATPLSKIHHLKEEVNELIADIEAGSPKRKEEYADCIILLMGAMREEGYSYDDISDMVHEKMKVNKGRSWGNPDENGVVKHLKNSNH